MQEHGLCVPKAILLEKDMEQSDKEALVEPFYNNPLVVKPRNTNYGTGITVFAKPASKKQISNAINYAFEFDNNVLNAVPARLPFTDEFAIRPIATDKSSIETPNVPATEHIEELLV